MPRDKGEEESLDSLRKSLGVLGFIGFEQPNLSIHLAMTCGRRHAVVLVVLQCISLRPKLSLEQPRLHLLILVLSSHVFYVSMSRVLKPRVEAA